MNLTDRCTTKASEVEAWAYIQCQLIYLIGFTYRHNGVIIEPTEVEKKKGSTEPQASGSQSHSRSPSPSPKGAENPTDGAPTPVGALGGSQGPHSYYRQHTMPAGGRYICSRPTSPSQS